MTIIAGAHRVVPPTLSRQQPITDPLAADPAFVSSRPASIALSRLCATTSGGYAMPPVGTVRTNRPDPAASEDVQRCGTATFGVRRPSAIRVAIAVVGDIDALNAREFGRYVERYTGISRQLVLDLRAVDFFGSHGFTALYYISVHCARSDVDWSIVASPAVRRLLSVCDPEGELPLAEDLPTAVARLDRVAQCCHRVAVHK